MALLKLDIEKFDGNGDFGIWRKKMRAVLVQQKVSIVLNEYTVWRNSDKIEARNFWYCFHQYILNLSDWVLCKVNGETKANGFWKKLEDLYLKKTLSNKIYLKKKLFGYKMDASKTLKTNLDDFKKVTIDFGQHRKGARDENQVVILLNALLEFWCNKNCHRVW